MLFNSFSYLIFFIIIVTSYYLTPNKYRYILLLIGSYYFYMCWSPILIFLILFSSVINYLFSILIYTDSYNSKKYLTVTLIINFSLLFIFKYLNFTSSVLFEMFNVQRDPFSIILPMGISFYTFQATGYTIDVYRGKIKPERNFFKFSLFITYFPQLVAGPIERAENLLHKLYSKKKFDIKNIELGLKYMIYGYFKKIVIADRISVVVDKVYNDPTSFSGLALIVATFLFAIQIYCDFSGYTDIARGSSKMLGIDLIENFKQPYFSKSIKEFWSRWHISLSSWFRDYLYIPLGGNRKGRLRTYFNTFITFIVSGIWHGANFTFVIWGALNGIFNVAGDLTTPTRKNLLQKFNLQNNFILKIFSTTTTFLLVCFCWIFFRANSISDAFYIVNNLFVDFNLFFNSQYIFKTLTSVHNNLYEILMSFFLIALLMLFDAFAGDKDIHLKLLTKNKFLRFSFYYIVTFFVLIAGVYYGQGEFIYFQF